MRKSLLIIGALVLSAATMQARTITPAEATQIAASFNSKTIGAARIKAVAPTIQPTLVYTEREDGDDLFYVFNRPGRGYIIIAADDKAETVLAYSDNNELTDIDAVPANMRAWLAEYARQIKAAKASPMASAPRHAARQQVSPLLTTEWGQNSPFNDGCPEVNLAGGGTGNAVTGCVATAMAQVMRYYRHPDAPRGDLHYVWAHTDKDLVENVTRHFSGHPYDWDNMLDSYESGDITDDQKNAVSVLMADAAYSVEMQFSETSSGAATQLVPFAMATYFDYDASAIYEERGFHDNAEWEGLICDELEAHRPVIYTGQTKSAVAHTWVIDGTDGNGMYHINWGWRGFEDGYFALTGSNILAPETGGTGGAASKESFDMAQAAILGLKPDEGGQPRVDFVSMDEETLSLTTLGRPVPAPQTYEEIWLSLKGSFLNHSNRGTDRYCDFGLRVTNTVTGESLVFKMPLQNPVLMQSMSRLGSIDVSKSELDFLPNGQYLVEAVFRDYTVIVQGGEMQYVGDGVWKTFRHLHGAPVGHTITLTGNVPDIYLTEPVENTVSAADHLVFKATLHANKDMDTYLVPLLFEPNSFDAEGNPVGWDAFLQRQIVTNTHVVMSAGETKTVWLGEWKYTSSDAQLPQYLLMQLSLTSSSDGYWDGGSSVLPMYRNQVIFQPTKATAIATARISDTNARPEVYTIDGQRVGQGIDALKPGLYIIGGKKVMVK